MSVFAGRRLVPAWMPVPFNHYWEVWQNGKLFEPRVCGRKQPRQPPCWTWGNVPDGRWELAWILLYLSTRQLKAAEKWAHDFSVQVLAKLPDNWVLDSSEIAHWYAYTPERPTTEREMLDAQAEGTES